MTAPRDIGHLGGLPVYFSNYLPVGGFWCHPDTLKMRPQDVERTLARLAEMMRSGQPGGTS